MQRANLFFEKRLWKKGFSFVAGLDEVGRGCFAGPVVAGCVVFGKDIENKIVSSKVRIDDSKKLTPRQRKLADSWIRTNALAWGIGEASVSLINKGGMAKATKVAFRRAVSQANKKLKLKMHKDIEYLLLDAFYVPFVRGFPKQKKRKIKGDAKRSENLRLLNSKARQLAILNGDQKSISIASASILAKVFRDKLMLSLSKKPKLKVYDWGKNKGYGTKKHQEAILKFGITRYHRKEFVRNFLAKV